MHLCLISWKCHEHLGIAVVNKNVSALKYADSVSNFRMTFLPVDLESWNLAVSKLLLTVIQYDTITVMEKLMV